MVTYDLTPHVPYRPLRWPDAVLEIADLLADDDDPIYIVGGAVRDALLGRLVKDLDLATPGDAIAIAKRVANSFPGGALFVMDAERGVARSLIETMHGPLHVDVATFRGEAGDDLLADLQDRDFTLNAMAVDLQGDLNQLIDPLGGEGDVAKKILRRCRPGVIESDRVRALRAIRQSTQLGFRVEPETLAEVRSVAGTLHETVSAERIRDAFFNTLSLPRPVAALRVLNVIGLMDDVLGMAWPSDRKRRDFLLASVDRAADLLRNLIPSQRGAELSTDIGHGLALMQMNRVRAQMETHIQATWANDRSQWALLMLTLLVQDAGEQLEDLAERLRLSNPEKKRVMSVVGARGMIGNMGDLTPLTMHRFWYPLRASGVDVCLVTLIDYLAVQGPMLQQDPWLVLVDRVVRLLEVYFLEYETIVDPPTLIDGKELMAALDLKPGKQIGELLEAIREAQVMGEVQTVDEAVAYAAGLLGG